MIKIIDDLRLNLLFISPERLEMLAKERSAIESFGYLLVCLLGPYIPALILDAIFYSISDALGYLLLIAIALPMALAFMFINAAVSYGILRLLDGTGGFMETFRVHIYGSTLSNLLSIPIILTVLVSLMSGLGYLGDSDFGSLAISGVCISFPLGIFGISLINVVEGMSRLHRSPRILALLAVTPFPIITAAVLGVLGVVLFFLLLLVAIMMAAGFHGPGMY